MKKRNLFNPGTCYFVKEIHLVWPLTTKGDNTDVMRLQKFTIGNERKALLVLASEHIS